MPPKANRPRRTRPLRPPTPAATGLALLVNAGTLFAASLTIEETLRALTQLVVPLLADWCMVDLRDEDGTVRRLEVTHPDAQQAAILQQLPDAPIGSHPGSPIEQAVMTGVPTLFASVGEAELRRLARSAQHLELLRAMPLRSMLVVPIMAGEQPVGALTLAALVPRRRYTRGDLEVARELGSRAAVAVENARLFDAERRARAEAEGAQRRMGTLTEMLDRALIESELLNTIAAAASGESDLNRILSTAFDYLRRILRFTGGAIALVEGDDLVIRAASGAFADRALGQRVPRGPARSWRVVEESKPFLSADVVAEGLRPTTPLRSYLAVPLIWQGRAFGLMEVDSTEPEAFGPEDQRLLERVATVLSGPIQLAQRYAAEVRALADAEDAQRRLALLAEAGRVLADSLDYETTLANIARLAVPMLADWCIVDLLSPDGTLQQVAAAHAQPEKELTIRELRRSYPPGHNHSIYKVLHSGQAELMPRISTSELASRAVDAAHLQLLEELGITSHLVVPLRVGGHILGAISFVAGHSGRSYSIADLPLAEELARRAAAAIENARLYAAEREARGDAEQAVRRIDALNRLVSVASSALDLGDVFDEFGDILQTLVPFVRLTVSLYVPDADRLTTPYVKGPALGVPARSLEGPKQGTVRGWVIDHSRPFVRVDAAQLQEFAEDDVLGSAGVRSYVVLPMTIAGRTIGTLNFDHTTPGFYTAEHARLAQPVADHLALTVSRYQLFEEVQRRAGELSETLQRALLPAELPQPPFAALRALYLPADPDAGIGGDWYDAVLLPADTLLLSMGDVAGHGVAAAAAMGQVRHLVRAYAVEGRAPAEILNTVNQFLAGFPETEQLTLWVAVFDPFTRRLAYAGAGHPPVLLALPDGDTQHIASAGPPVGFAGTTKYGAGTVLLPPGTRLIAYTDGLIEARRDIAAGEQRLLDAARAARAAAPAEAVRMIADRVLMGQRHEDDIAIMILDVDGDGAPLEFALPAIPDSLPRVRRVMREYGRRLALGAEQAEAMVIAVGEAALNAVEHAYRGTPAALMVRARSIDGGLTVEVVDRGQWRTSQQQGRGRGTRIMQGFAHTVRTHSGPGGTAVELTWPLPAVDR